MLNDIVQQYLRIRLTGLVLVWDPVILWLSGAGDTGTGKTVHFLSGTCRRDEGE